MICPTCDFILDDSFLGSGFTGVTPADGEEKPHVGFEVRTRAIPPLPSPPTVDFQEMTEANELVPAGTALWVSDSLILGDLADENLASFQVEDSGLVVRELTHTRVYVGGAIRELLAADAVPLAVRHGAELARQLSPFESHLLEIIDGTLTTAQLRQRSRLEPGDFEMTLSLLADKGWVRPAHLPAPREEARHGRIHEEKTQITRVDGRSAASESPWSPQDTLAGADPGDQTLLAPRSPFGSEEPSMTQETVSQAVAEDTDAPDDVWAPSEDLAADFSAPSTGAVAVPRELAPRSISYIELSAFSMLPSAPVEDDGAPRSSGTAEPQAAPVEVPFELRRKASRIFEHAERDFAVGRVSSALMNAKLAAIYDPSAPRYPEAVREWGALSQVSSSAQVHRATTMLDEANAAEQRGECERAEGLLRQILEENPTSAAIHNRLGVLLATRMRRYQEAAMHVMRAIDLSPTNLTYKNNLGKILAKEEAALRNLSPRGDPGAPEGEPVMLKKLRPRLR
ncbi:MAG: hypothetical protein ACO3JL_10105 [Myxococcota bacterium]